ncbi:hypothetical protein JNUCC1_01436 [Lentibacillus sp. JNUCC-1]|uniref:IS4 family transposase n=1 Tax=Lentibacillus sp. JNUCC-1 TaxID=2654513 RepID=UPI0013291367|nr:IS4 family transposase [Lentibacillus sp. JNUCC-1]MUV37630.1 hypothetical protein [Lentibacillus sp. JNUCC-1]
MKSPFTFLEAIGKTKEILHNVNFMIASRRKSTYFTRQGNNKLTFQSIILFHLSIVRKSLQLELDDFCKKLDCQMPNISKQGYLEARKKIDPYAFSYLFHSIADAYYEATEYKTFRGYRLCAVDGTTIKLHHTQPLIDYYGTAQNQKVNRARANAGAIYDIQNDLFRRAKIAPYATSERDLAKELIDSLPSKNSVQDLILFDRGYPAREFVDYLERSGIKYVMRCPKSGVMKEVKNTTKKDQTIQMKYKKEVYNLRVIRFFLDSGEEEILLTNIMDQSFDVPTFKDLYFKRWGIEVKYDTLKNKLNVENFSGTTPLTVEQDFYASFYLINMASLIHGETTECIEREDHDKSLKYKYKANMNRVIAKLKEYLIYFFNMREWSALKQLYKQLIDEAQEEKTPERPGRRCPRNETLRSNPYALNQKGALP